MADYVEYGSLATVPGPLTARGATEWGFALKADHEKLEALCMKVFAGPTGGAIDIRPLGQHVLLTLGRIDRLVSDLPPFDSMGWSPESQVDIWIPAARVTEHGDHLVAEELLMFMPYIWIDNSLSLPSGREMYGYPKALCWALLPEDGAEETSLGVDVFGMNYDRDPPEEISRRELIRLQRGGQVHEPPDDEFEGLHDIGRHLRHLVEARPGEAVRPGLHFAAELAKDVLAGRLRQVFLKQIRAVEDGQKAALQQVTEAPYKILKMSGRPLLHEWACTIEHLDSHPLREELGLEDQTTRWAFRTKSDFELEQGKVLWDAAAA
jgi:hypothetical protein